MHPHSVNIAERKNGVCATADKGGFLEESEGGKRYAGGYREAFGRVAFNIRFRKRARSILFHFSGDHTDKGTRALLHSHAR